MDFLHRFETSKLLAVPTHSNMLPVLRLAIKDMSTILHHSLFLTQPPPRCTTHTNAVSQPGPSLIAGDATLQQAHLAAATSGCRHFILNRGDLEVARLKHGTPRSKEWKAIPTYQNKSLTNTLPTTVFSAPPSHWLARPRHADVSPAQKLPGIALVLCPIQAKKLPSASNVA